MSDIDEIEGRLTKLFLAQALGIDVAPRVWGARGRVTTSAERHRGSHRVAFVLSAVLVAVAVIGVSIGISALRSDDPVTVAPRFATTVG